MRADIHGGPEHPLQSEAGYIDARPHSPVRGILLRRTAGPYNRVNRVGSPTSALRPLMLQEQRQSDITFVSERRSILSYSLIFVAVGYLPEQAQQTQRSARASLLQAPD